MRVLVTGFGPFLDHAVNPSDALARALDGRRALGVELRACSPLPSDALARALDGRRALGVELRACSPLPVEHGRAAAWALEAARRHAADAIVAFGLAAGTPHVRVERRGRNRATSPHADGAGRVAAGTAVVPGAPGALAATIPDAPLRAALAAAGIASSPSEDAGGYVCNDLFFRLLHARRRALFVHVPPHLDVPRAAGPMALGIARAVIASAGHGRR